MEESKMTTFLLFGIVALMLFTYFFTMRINLGSSVEMNPQIVAAINA